MMDVPNGTKVVPHHKRIGDNQGTMEYFMKITDHAIVNFFKRRGYLIVRRKDSDKYVLWDGVDGGFFFREDDFVLYQKKRESL